MLLKEGLIRGRFYWIFVILTTTLSYGFTLTNYSMGVDDESFKEYFHEGVLLSQGRWGSTLTRYFFDTYEFLPFWRDFIAIILIVIGITLWGHIIKKNSNGYFNETGITIFACVAISSPFIVSNFIFMMTTVETGLVLCLTAVSINSFLKVNQEENRYVALLISVCSLVYAVSFSELAMVYFLIGIFIIGFLRICFLEVKQERKTITFFLLNGLFLMVIVLLINNIIRYTLQKIFAVASSDYVSNMVLYDFSSLNSFVRTLLSFLKSFFVLFLTRDHPGVKVVVLSSIIILAVGIFLSIKRRNVFLFLIGLGLVLSAYSLFFLTGNIDIPYRTMITNSIFVGFTIALMYMFLKRELTGIKLTKLILILICMLTVYQTKYINEIFYTDYLRFQLDKAKANIIATDILEESGNINNKVVFIGQPDNYNLKIGDVEGYSIFQWGRFGGIENEFKNNRSILSFINLQGYSLQSANDLKLSEVLKEAADMPMYPVEGYIKNVGQYLIVKIGYTPQFFEFDANQFSKIKQDSSNIKLAVDLFSYENKEINISGWSFLEDKKTTSESIRVALLSKANKYSIATRTVSREDVLRAFPNLEKADDLGFQLSFPTDLIKPGKYEVALIFSNGPKQQMVYLDKNIIVQ